MRILRYLKDRFREASTWSVLSSILAGSLGCYVNPEHSNEIVTGLVSVLSLIGIITPEKKG